MATADPQRDIAAVLGRVPSGIFVLTASDGAGHETGMLCSWVQQSSFTPPAVTIALRRDRYVNEWLSRTRKATLNLVGESAKQFLVHFGRGFKIDEPAFEGIDIRRGLTGLPVLVEALGYLEGNIVGSIAAGDHLVHVLEIVAAGAGEMLHEEHPMVHVRKSGLSY